MNRSRVPFSIAGAMMLIYGGWSLHASATQPNEIERIEHVIKLRKAPKEGAKEAIATLLSYLQDKSPKVRSQALVSMTSLLRDHKLACTLEMIKMLFDPDADVRASASNMVAAFERYPDGALPLLLKAMESEDAFVRHHAPHMLSYMGKNDQVVAALRKGMQDRDFMVRNNAGVALGKILDDFSIPIPCWLEAIGKSEENQLAKKPILEKEEAHLMNMLALSTATLFHDESRNNPKRFADALVKQLDHASPLVRRIAVRQLGAAAIDNPKLKEVFQSMQLLKTLQRFVDDADTRMRAEVKTAIERIQQK